MDAKKAAEVAIAQQVAAIRGGTVRAEDGQWPDAWIDDVGGSIPVEVVAGFERPYGERPKQGAAVVREGKRAEREADRRTAAGEVVAYGAHAFGESAVGFVVSLEKDERIPPPMNPANPVGWIIAAIQQKLEKHYGDARATVLVVDYQWPPPEPYEVQEVGNELEEIGVSFREVWVVSPFSIGSGGLHVQRVPYKPA